MSPLAALDAEGNPVADHTVDPGTLAEGQLVYLHGFEPAVVFGIEPDGKVEVGRFAEFLFTEAGNLSSARGPRPDWAGPEPEAPADRIASLEKQLAALTALLAQPQVAAAIQGALGQAPPPPPAEPPAPPADVAPPAPPAPAAPAPLGFLQPAPPAPAGDPGAPAGERV